MNHLETAFPDCCKSFSRIVYLTYNREIIQENEVKILVFLNVSLCEGFAPGYSIFFLNIRDGTDLTDLT